MLTQAVILVGGLGSRLGQRTVDTPKPLLQVSGRPFIEHIIQEVSRFGVKRATLLAGRFGEKVASLYHGRRLFGVDLDVLVEPEPLGTGGAIVFAARQGALESEFLLMNGDSWIDMSLIEVQRVWENRKRAGTGKPILMLLQTVPDARRFGTVEAADGLATAFREKCSDGAPENGLINAGVYIVSRDLVETLPSGQAFSLETDVFPKLVEQQDVSVTIAPPGTFFIDIGLPDTLEQADAVLMSKRTRPAVFMDRDGTLNIDAGYTHRPEDLVWHHDAREAVKFANSHGYFVFVVTNQAGVARGLYSETDVVAFHAAMSDSLFEIGAHIDAFEWCPHHEQGSIEAYMRPCRRRKPEPGMLLDLIAEWPVDLERSLMVGDKEHDLRAGEASGIRSVLFTGGSLLDLVRNYIA